MKKLLTGASVLAVAATMMIASPSFAQTTGAGAMDPNTAIAPAGAPGTTEQPSANTGANAQTNGNGVSDTNSMSNSTGTTTHRHRHHHATPASSTNGSMSNGSMSNGSMNNGSMSNGSMSGTSPNGSNPATNSTTNPGGAPNTPAGAATPH